MRFFRYLGRAFLKIYYEFVELIKINILWFLLTLPIFNGPRGNGRIILRDKQANKK